MNKNNKHQRCPVCLIVEDILHQNGKPMKIDDVVAAIKNLNIPLSLNDDLYNHIRKSIRDERKILGDKHPINTPARCYYALVAWNVGDVSDFRYLSTDPRPTARKFCQKCGEIKEINKFSSRKEKEKYIINVWCKSCISKIDKEYAQKPEIIEREKIRSKKRYAERDVEKTKIKNREYLQNNKERIYERLNKFKEENREKVLEYQRKSNQKRRALPRNRVDSSMTRDVGRSLKAGQKANRTWEELVGYTINDLTKHLEAKFVDGMTWDNYGRGGWHLDHIKPLASFHYEDENNPQFKEAWALENLQPLWEKDNIIKGSLYNGKRHYYPK